MPRWRFDFVFLVDVETEAVDHVLIKLGCKTRVHYSIQEALQRSGAETRDDGTGLPGRRSGAHCFFWQGADGRWTEVAYEHFATEQVDVEGRKIEKPWTPHFVFHGQWCDPQGGDGVHCVSLRLSRRYHCRQSVPRLRSETVGPI